MKGITNKILFILLWISTVLLTITICFSFFEPEVVVNINGGQEYFEENGEIAEEAAQSIETGASDVVEDSSVEIDKINLNTAEKEVLMEIPGIGDKTSDKIIEYRENNKFDTIEEIMEIKGIGEGTFSKIKEYITVN